MLEEVSDEEGQIATNIIKKTNKIIINSFIKVILGDDTRIWTIQTHISVARQAIIIKKINR